jgi:hypothetical protein
MEIAARAAGKNMDEIPSKVGDPIKKQSETIAGRQVRSRIHQAPQIIHQAPYIIHQAPPLVIYSLMKIHTVSLHTSPTMSPTDW